MPSIEVIYMLGSVQKMETIELEEGEKFRFDLRDSGIGTVEIFADEGDVKHHIQYRDCRKIRRLP